MRLGRKPGGSLQRAARKNGAVGRPVRQGELLAGACEEHRVLADHIAPANDRESDVAAAADRIAAVIYQRNIGKLLRPGLRDSVPERKRGA